MSKRIPQVNELLAEEVAMLIRKEIEIPKNVILTIAKVDTTSDLKETVFSVTIMPEALAPVTMATLKKASGTLQHLLIKKLAMNHVPRIRFALTTFEDVMNSPDALLDRISQELKDSPIE